MTQTARAVLRIGTFSAISFGAALAGAVAVRSLYEGAAGSEAALKVSTKNCRGSLNVNLYDQQVVAKSPLKTEETFRAYLAKERSELQSVLAPLRTIFSAKLAEADNCIFPDEGPRPVIELKMTWRLQTDEAIVATDFKILSVKGAPHLKHRVERCVRAKFNKAVVVQASVTPLKYNGTFFSPIVHKFI